MSMFKRERLAQVEAKAASEGPKHTVLIVDDEEGNLKALRGVLGSAFNILEARDGQAALELLQSLPPDQVPSVILSDQRMPRMTGVELFSHLRESLPAGAASIVSVAAFRAHGILRGSLLDSGWLEAPELGEAWRGIGGL